MTIGRKWLAQAEAAAEARVGRMLDAAERELRDILPGARIEQAGGELRIGARRLLRRWIAEPALRFLLWRAK